MSNSMSMSALENKLMDNVFRTAQSSGQQGAVNAAGAAGTAETMARYAFKDFVHYFMMLEEQAKAAARQAQPVSGNQAASPLMSGGMQLDIRVKRYETEAPAASQPVTVRQHDTAQSGARQIEIHGSEQRDDGTVVHTVTVIELAVVQAYVLPPIQTAKGGGTGQLNLAQATGTAGDSLDKFFERSPYAGAAGQTLWQYSSNDAMKLVKEEKRLDDFAADQAMQKLIEVAYKVLKYMQTLELDTEFKLTKDESKLVQEALSNNPSDVVIKSVLKMLKKKKIKVAKVKQEVKKQHDELEQKLKALETQNTQQLAELQKSGQTSSEETQKRTEEISKVSQQIKQLKKVLKAIQAFEYVPDEQQENLSPDVFKQLLEEFNQANLDMAT